MSNEQQDQAAEPEQSTVRVPVGERDAFGRYREHVEAENEEAARHWDATRWERWS